jgi:hypothetical protein
VKDPDGGRVVPLPVPPRAPGSAAWARLCSAWESREAGREVTSTPLRCQQPDAESIPQADRLPCACYRSAVAEKRYKPEDWQRRKKVEREVDKQRHAGEVERYVASLTDPDEREWAITHVKKLGFSDEFIDELRNTPRD